MGAITRPHHTGLQVADLERSLAFYRDVLGFELVFAWNPQAPYIGELVGYPDVDLHAAVVKPPNSEVFLELLEYRNVEKTPVDPRNANPGTAHTAYYVDDLGGRDATLAAKGVKSVSPPVPPTIEPNAGGRAVDMIQPDRFRAQLTQT